VLLVLTAQAPIQGLGHTIQPHSGGSEPNWFPDESRTVSELLSDTHNMTLPTRGPPSGGYKIGIVILWLGELPTYVNYFVASCRRCAALVDIVIFTDADWHAQVNATAVPPNVQFMPLTAEQLAKRAAPFLSGAKACSVKGTPLVEHLVSLLRGPDTHEGQGHPGSHALFTSSKVNDFKPLIGAMFEEELRNYSHWGWMDMDMFLGDLGSALTPFLDTHDVITFPDGQLAAIFTAGQLTVFRNIDYFRTFFDVPYSCDTCHPKKVHKLELLCKPVNHLWDEQFTIWHAQRHPLITIAAAMSAQFSGSGRPWQQHFIVREDGRLVRPVDGVDIETELASTAAAAEPLRGMEGEHSCVSWYHPGWSWVCIEGTESNPAPVGRQTQLFTWDGRHMTATALPVQKIPDTQWSGGFVVEGAFFHMHHWKKSAEWMFHDAGWQRWGRTRINIAIRDKGDVAARRPCCAGLKPDHGGTFASYAQGAAISGDSVLVGYIGIVRQNLEKWAVMWVADEGWDAATGEGGVVGKRRTPKASATETASEL
jgi:hypothetical protein